MYKQDGLEGVILSNLAMSAHGHFLQANEKYAASFGDKGSLAIPPAKKLAVGTCHAFTNGVRYMLMRDPGLQ
jgi:hypothetical protein